MKNQNIVLLTTTLLILFFTEFSYCQLTTTNGVINLRNQQLIGDNLTGLYYDSNHSNTTTLIFRDKEDNEYGRIHGNENGLNFGLLDSDRNWSYRAAKDSFTIFLINNREKMRIRVDGNIGIGTSNPGAKLEINGGPFWTSNGWRKAVKINDSDAIQFDAGAGSKFGIGASSSGGRLYFFTTTTESNDDAATYRMVIENNGNVGIGSSDPQYKLDVCGEIRANEVIVEDNWCDFVFEPEYCLSTLEEEEDFIKLYGHLSNFESAKDMNGFINVNDIFKRQQVQIEENVLHLIEMNDENNALQIEVDQLKAGYALVLKEIAELKAQLK